MTQLEKMISDSVYNITGIRVDDEKSNLLSKKYKIYYVYFLYVFKELEEEFEIPIFKIFEDLVYYEFTIQNIAQKISCLMVI